MPNSETNHRPICITLLVLLTGSIVLWNGLRLSQAISFWDILDEYGGRPLYIAISSGVWFLGGLILCFGQWRGKYWSWPLSIGAALAYEAYYWLDQLIIQKLHTNLPFVSIFNLLLLSIVGLILLSCRTQKYFSRDLHER